MASIEDSAQLIWSAQVLSAEAAMVGPAIGRGHAMKVVRRMIYRFLTDADFYNLYKPVGSEDTGGGQTYIDVRTSAVSVEDWRQFLEDATGFEETAQTDDRPGWRFIVHSIGVTGERSSQELSAYQRRDATVAIANQYIHSRNANRVEAWHPMQGFPEPDNPSDRHQLPPGLGVFFIQTEDRQVWAGWFDTERQLCRDYESEVLIGEALVEPRPGDTGIIEFPQELLLLDEYAASRPLLYGGTPEPREWDEERRNRELLREDLSHTNMNDAARRRTAEVRLRNARAVRALKQLYQRRCQITGDEYAFEKANGEHYVEAHHLIPLGEGGADDARNMVVVSPLVHAMLHYATVDPDPIDLSGLEEHADGTATLGISINDQPYTIKWHPDHASIVLDEDGG